MKLNLKSFGNFRAIIGLLSLALLTQTVFAETRFSNEFWVSTSTNTLNYGTLDNPYDGSTQPKFDAVLANLPPYSTLHILAGTYQTHGDSGNSGYGLLKSGQKIAGSGIDATIIQLSPVTPDGGSGPCVLSTYSTTSGCTNIEVCDLTCDCNYNGTNNNRNGIYINGTQNAVRRVKVIHAVYISESSEAWGIVLANNFLPDSVGNIIEECEVSQFAGVLCGISAISFNGWSNTPMSGVMRNNRVFLTTSHGIAFNNSYTHDLLIEGNYVDGAQNGVYSDEPGSTNMIIAHNTFKNCSGGVNFENFVRQNITIAYNNFEPADGNSIGIDFDMFTSHPSYCTNIAIIGNTFTLKDQGTGTAYAIVMTNYVSGLVCVNNRMDPSMINSFSGCTGVNIYNNYDLNGNFLTNLNQVASPNGITRRTVTYPGSGTDTYNATFADKYIGIKGFSNDSQLQEVDIVLPVGAGHPGKDFVVVDETGLASTTKLIKIMPAPGSPDLINGTSSVSITAPNTAKTAISDGTNWFAR